MKRLKIAGVLLSASLCLYQFDVAKAERMEIDESDPKESSVLLDKEILISKDSGVVMGEIADYNVSIIELDGYKSSHSPQVKAASDEREAVVDLALQYVGNKYVWGGESLTDGVDCSGFVQAVYKKFGYEIPRVAQEQSKFGYSIAVSDVQPGDLVFFGKNGRVKHVALYIGNKQIVEAANERLGLIISDFYAEKAMSATRIITDLERNS